MTASDIRGNAAALAAAIKTDDEETAHAAALALLVGFLTDVNRLADAAEAIAVSLAKAADVQAVVHGVFQP